MQQKILIIKENHPLTKDVYKMVLEGDTSAITASGQFVNLKLDGLYLRRPISVCDYDEHSLTLLYKVMQKPPKSRKFGYYCGKACGNCWKLVKKSIVENFFRVYPTHCDIPRGIGHNEQINQKYAKNCCAQLGKEIDHDRN